MGMTSYYYDGTTTPEGIRYVVHAESGRVICGFGDETSAISTVRVLIAEYSRNVAQRDALAKALRAVLNDHDKHAHGTAAPGHMDHIRAARAALAKVGE
jgi:LmbE family N-acetylglucosaminyl deacetylase